MATLGKSGSFTVTVPSYNKGTGYVVFYWREYYDVTTNTSTINIYNVGVNHTYHTGTWQVGATIKAGTIPVGTFHHDYWSGYLSGSGADAVIKDSSGNAVSLMSENIEHYADGTKNVTLNVTIDCLINRGAGWVVYGQTFTTNITLTTLPRASELAASNGTLGVAQNLTVTKHVSGFTHTITYTCGTASGTICTKSSATTVSATLPLSLAAQNTSGENVVVVFRLQTYSGNTAIGGEVTKTVYMYIPLSVTPTATVAVSDPTGYATTFGGYVQGQSKLKIVTTPSLAYDSPIVTYNVTADGNTYTAADVTTDIVKNSGEQTVKSKVIDKRGRGYTASADINVLPYTLPAISKLTVHRCNSDGTENNMGSYAKVTYSFAITSLSNKNAKTIKLQYKKSSATSYTTVTLTSAYSATNAEYIFAADDGSSYDIMLTVADTFNSAFPTTRSTSVSTAQVITHWNASGNGISFGKISEKANAVEFGWEAFDRFGTVITNGLAEYTGAADAGIDPDTTLEELILSSHTNAPQGKGTFYYIHTAFYSTKSTTAARAQFAFPYSKAGSLYHRYYQSGAWSAWSQYMNADDAISNCIDTLYPVGSIVIRYDHTSPASIYGGTWTRIIHSTGAGTFLYASTAAATIGECGGEAEVTLTVNEMPAHKFTPLSGGYFYATRGRGSSELSGMASGSPFSDSNDSGGVARRVSTNTVGGGAAHNNIPPYIKVSVWRRTA